MAAPTGENVVRGGKTGGLTNKYNYDSAKGGAVAGWSKVDDVAGQVDDHGTNGDHFSKAEHTGNDGHSQPGSQT